jgi:ribosomal-protein-alanine N-acetyltransferase
MESIEHFYRVFAAFPRIELKRIRLREFRESDAEAYYHYVNHPEVRNFVPVDCVPKSVESAVEDVRYYKSNIERYVGISWAIAHKKTDEIIGSIGLTMMKFIQRKSNISYDLSFEHWGKGLAKEAMIAVLSFADEELKLNRIQANIATENERSRGFCKSFGFEYEGTLRKFEVLNDKVVDFDVFARIR